MDKKASTIKLCSFWPSCKHNVHHTYFIGVLVCYFRVCFVLSRVSLLHGDKQEAKFKGVMSVPNTHYRPMF